MAKEKIKSANVNVDIEEDIKSIALSVVSEIQRKSEHVENTLVVSAGPVNFLLTRNTASVLNQLRYDHNAYEQTYHLREWYGKPVEMRFRRSDPMVITIPAWALVVKIDRAEFTRFMEECYNLLVKMDDEYTAELVKQTTEEMRVPPKRIVDEGCGSHH